MLADRQLLRRYAADGSEAAFGELVGRYVNLVYSAALRRTGGDPELAKDAAQLVFTDLARKARAFPPGVVLAGWLHRATRFAAGQLLRTERRRQAREQEAVAMNALEAEPAPDWDQIRPLLDAALDRLDRADRDALLLRFFEQRSLAEVGQTLGANEDAARKRVSRALEKLRADLVRRGVTTTAAALSTAISVNAVQVAPAGLAAALTSASLAGAAAGTGTTLTLLKFMVMTKLKAGIISAIVVAGVATPLVVQHLAEVKLRTRDQALQEREEQLAQLATENQRLSNLAAQARKAPALTGEPFSELLRLRSEVGLLREKNQELARLISQQQQGNSLAQALSDSNVVFVPSRVVTSMNPPRPIKRTFEAGQLQDVGNESIESAAQTALWAVLNRDEAGFGRISYVDTNAPPMSVEGQTKQLDQLARSMDGVQNLTLNSWLPDPERDGSVMVFFKAAWPNDSQAVDKPAGGTLLLRRAGTGWYLDAFVGQGRPRP